MAEKTGALTYDEIYKKLEELDDDLFISGSDPGAESEGNMIFDEGLRKSLGEARFHNMTFLLPIDTKELLNLSPEKLSYMIVLMNKR